MPAFRLTQFRHFSTVCELQSISVAARVLHISQPALSRSIQRLEKEVRGPLFERRSNGVELTARGESLLPYVRAILAEADRATEQLRRLGGQLRLQIRLGTSPNFSQHVCPDIVREFVARYPDSSIRLSTGTGEQLISMLTASELDLAITLAWGTTLQMAVAKGQELAHETLAQVTTCILAPRQHPLAEGGTELTLKEAARHRWAVPHGLSLSYIFEDVFVSNNLSAPTQVINTSNMAQLMALGQHLNLLIIAPRHIALEGIATGAVIPLRCDALELQHSVEMIIRRRGTRAAGLDDFCELARREFRAVGLSDSEPENPPPLSAPWTET